MRRPCWVLALVTGFVLAACSPPNAQVNAEEGATEAPAETSPGASPEDGSAPQLMPLEGATSVCTGHVTGAPTPSGPGVHISWEAFEISEARAEVAAAYEKQLGTSHHEATETSDTWRYPSDAPTGVLAVHEATEPGPWSSCEDAPTSGTIIMISTLARP